MFSSTTMFDTNRELPEKKKVKKKMSKAQMQLAIIKKKQCDAKALNIVERLLEPNVDTHWLISNLVYINKSHMEDVIEERAIIKICGYVLCDKPLTVVIRQQYHISTKKNKVYDVSRRKNFCSSRCYGACNYLLEQMLTSPLWLREKEDIPDFHLLPTKDELERSTPGEEVNVGGPNVLLDNDNANEVVQPDTTTQIVENINSDSQQEQNDNAEEMKQKDEVIESTDIKEIDVPINGNESHPETESSILETINSNLKSITIIDNTLEEVPMSNVNVEMENTELRNIEELNSTKIDNNKSYELSQLKEGMDDAKDSPTTETKNDKSEMKRAHKLKKEKRKDSDKLENQPKKIFTLVTNIEQSVREWITEDTLYLLSGEENTKNRLLENVTQHDKYVQLCKKLNKLQLEDEKDDRTELDKNALKPLPHFSVLQEEGRKMDLKVRAFYKGKTIIDTPESAVEDTDKNDDSAPILPLTEAHAPKALRRRIFLDKLNRILPDLLRALASSRQSQPIEQYTYSSERSALLKALVNTFSLTATNIFFKTAEWTLVGLIIIKMLSTIDPPLKALLATKQASMYSSMILMSYKLDSNYLDRLVIELTNNPKIFNTHL